MVIFLVTVKKEEEILDSKTKLIIEKTLLKIKEKGILKKQEIHDIEIMQRKLNHNIFLFMLFLALLQIHLIAD